MLDKEKQYPGFEIGEPIELSSGRWLEPTDPERAKGMIGSFVVKTPKPSFLEDIDDVTWYDLYADGKVSAKGWEAVYQGGIPATRNHRAYTAGVGGRLTQTPNGPVLTFSPLQPKARK